MKREEKGCKIISENLKSVKIISVGKGILGSVHIKFNQEIARIDREKITKCLKKEKLNAVWGNKLVLVR